MVISTFPPRKPINATTYKVVILKKVLVSRGLSTKGCAHVSMLFSLDCPFDLPSYILLARHIPHPKGRRQNLSHDSRIMTCVRRYSKAGSEAGGVLGWGSSPPFFPPFFVSKERFVCLHVAYLIPVLPVSCRALANAPLTLTTTLLYFATDAIFTTPVTGSCGTISGGTKNDRPKHGTLECLSCSRPTRHLQLFDDHSAYARVFSKTARRGPGEGDRV